MKQVLQNLKTGETRLADVPCPEAAPGTVLVRTAASLVSSGTERMLVEFGKAGLIGKARQQPDKVRMVLQKVRTDGIAATLDAVRSKLDQPLPLGYSNAGRIVAIGPGVEGFEVGDRVVSNGPHAEFVRVPKNLCARIPEGVSDENASFTVLGAIALQGIRLVQPTLGESVVVVGLGLIGLLTVQLLRAHGCRVLGIDLDPAKVALAGRFGARAIAAGGGADPVREALTFSRGRGVDAVIITASTRSNEPVHQAALMCRKRGRIVLVGVTGLELSRADFYQKELSFQVSCSYGPGRYDPLYEEKGQDYPAGFVRWTEQRNFEAVLDMLADGRLDPAALISHRFELGDARQAYAVLNDDSGALGILLGYPQGAEDAFVRTSVSLHDAPPATPSSQSLVCGFIGAGNYASRVLIPAFRRAGARLDTLVTSGGVNAAHHGDRFGFAHASTRVEDVLENPDVNAVVIATRHDSHADLVERALAGGKQVFVEKPLALTADELDRIEAAYGRAGVAGSRPPVVMVGFNRRFAPHVVRVKQLLAGVSEPKAFIATVNAGEIPREHWTQDRAIGGGRIIGEGCHFVDLLRFLAGCPIRAVDAHALAAPEDTANPRDCVTITLEFADGSIGTVNYLANGGKQFPKERIEVFARGGVLQIDNFRRLNAFDWPGAGRMNLWRQDKGQDACVRAFLNAVAGGGSSPMEMGEILEVSRATIEAAEAAQR